jgi:hypothetical protein
MANVSLVRIVQPRVEVRDGRVSLVEEVKTTVVKFEGADGRSISLAFDGRASREGSDYRGAVREEYAPYGDCPVVDADGEAMRSGSDLQTMRFLRDALIAMDLGDYDPCANCIECGTTFIPEGCGAGTICPECAAKDYCSDCGEYTDCDDSGYCFTCAGRNE